MESRPGQAKENGKRQYRKPTLHQIPLRADEAVLAVCKTNTRSGPGTIGVSCVAGGCQTATS